MRSSAVITLSPAAVRGQPRPANESLPAGLRAEVAAYAEQHHILPQEALRYLIEAGLEAEARAMWLAAQADAGRAQLTAR